MCLKVTQTTPYSKSNWRYKILEIRNGKIVSLFRTDFHWNMGVSVSAKPDGLQKYDKHKIAGSGIHTIPTLEEAQKFVARNGSRYRPLVIAKVRVSGFLGAGININIGENLDGMRSEVWKRAKMAKIVKEYPDSFSQRYLGE